MVDQKKIKRRSLEQTEKNLIMKALVELDKTKRMLEYNVTMNQLALDQGIDLSAMNEKRNKQTELKTLKERLDETTRNISILQDQMKHGVVIKEKIDFNKIDYNQLDMMAFIKHNSLEVQYVEFQKDLIAEKQMQQGTKQQGETKQ